MRTERQQLKIKTISYKRTKQTKPYEPEVIELIIDLAPGETPKEVINKARNIVAEEFGEKPKACSCDSSIIMSKGCVCGGS
jgi:hypothetical protein